MRSFVRKARNFNVIFRKFSSSNVGLLGYDHLHKPEHFVQWAKKTRDEVAQLIRTTTKAPPSLMTLYNFDMMSNILCMVTDSAELCRQAHESEEWREAANQAFHHIATYMEELNSDSNLYLMLKRVDKPDILSTFTEEQKTQFHRFLHDMEVRGGAHLNQEIRTEASKLQNEIAQLEAHYQSGITSLHHGQRPSSEASFLSMFKSKKNQTSYMEVLRILYYNSDAALRKKTYLEFYHADNPPIRELLETLFSLVKKRSELAKLLGYKTAAHHSLVKSVAEDPLQVSTFLDGFCRALAPYAIDEQEKLLKLKIANEPLDKILHDWDKDYYACKYKQGYKGDSHNGLVDYFAIDNVFQGLNTITQGVFGLELVEKNMEAAETWTIYSHHRLNPLRVRKYEVVDVTTQKVEGIIYFDIFERPSKAPSSASYALQGGKLMRDSSGSPLGYQTPKIAVCMAITAQSGLGGALSGYSMTHNDFSTLCHELGHALHHILSRAEFQDAAGTRLPIDIVETPSTLMENFAADHRVLSKFAKHRSSGKILPKELLVDYLDNVGSLSRLDAMRDALWSLYSMRLHLEPQVNTGRSISWIPENNKSQYSDLHPLTALKAHIDDSYLPIYKNGRNSSNTGNSPATFLHLSNYGCSYYSYLYCRIFSSAIWETLFAQDPFNRESGDKLRKNFLAAGASKAPNVLLRDVLGKNPLEGISPEYAAKILNKPASSKA